MTTHKHYEAARRAYYNTSFSPERRAVSECEFYDSIQEEFKDSPEVLAKFERLFTDLLAKKSRCISSMITGPAKFPVARAEKANAAEHRASEALTQFLDKVRRRRDKPAPTAISSDSADAVAQLQSKLARLEYNQAMMREANKLLRSKPVNMVALAALLGSKEAAEKLSQPDCMGFIGFAPFVLTNNNAAIKATRERLEALQKLKAKPTTEREINGVKVVENVEENRLQLFFDGRPAANMIAKLKSHGFKWAPSKMAWQRQLTSNALYSLKSVLSA